MPDMAVEAQQSMMFRSMDLSDSSRGGGGGGGRRKQSKPSRLFGGVEPMDTRPVEADTMSELTDPKISPPAREMMEMDEDQFSCDLCSDTFMTQNALTEHIQQSHDLTSKRYGGGSPDIAYPTKYHQLGNEFQQETGLPGDEDDGGRNSPSVLHKPTPAESELATPSTPSNSIPGANGAQQGPPSPSDEMYQNINSEGEIINRQMGENGKARIFHKDGFCKMCDREFCNKYFLKTHMANKYGIYDSGSPPSSSSPKMFNGDSNSSSSNAVPTTASAPSFAETLAMLPSVKGSSGGFSAFGPPMPIPSLSESPKSNHSPASGPPPPLPPSMMTSLANSMSNSSRPYQLPLHPSLAPKQRQSPTHNSSNTLASTLSTMSSSSSSSSSKPTPKDMEDYCEICRKHLCDKYYLKKHKQDVHGIMPDPNTVNTNKRRSNQSSSNNGSSSSAATGAVSRGNVSPMTDVLSNAPLSCHLPHGMDGMPHGFSNVMFLNPFISPFAMLQNQSANALQAATATAGFPPGLPMPTPPPPPQRSSPINITSPGSMHQQPPTSSAASTNSSSSENKSNGEQKNEGGGEVYCDLCRKEFCNIHLLKIHKANMHGVFYEDLPLIIQQASMTPPMTQLPVLNVPSLPPSSTSTSEPSPHGGVIQIVPTAQESGLKVKMEKPDTARADNTEPPRPFDLFSSLSSALMKGEPCGICKKEFYNKHSLQMHMLNAHSMKPSDLDMALGMGPEPMQGTMFSNMIAPKLADRVMCDIGNKEVCNKYFLKTHKLKVHGIELNDRKNESPPRTKPSSVIKSSPYSRPPSSEPSFKQSSPPTKPAETPTPLPPRPNDDELLKMGIDPEAYCEICKKEFCSKYYLKTHRANIHGIKCSSSGSQSPEKYEKPIFSSNQKPLSHPNQSFLPHGFPPLDGHDFNGFPGLPVTLAQSLSQSLGGGGHLSLPPLPSQAAMGMLHNFAPGTTKASPAPAAAAESSSTVAMDTNDSESVMQSFSLQEQEEGSSQRVAVSVVQLPVFSKINEPVTVTFKLTPV